MHTIKLSIILLLSLFSSCGFYDFERAESKQILGNFYVVNLHLREHPGFLLVFRQKNGYERSFLEIGESIDYLKADDSLILIKAKPGFEFSYYLIEHYNGDSVLNVKRILDIDFKEYESKMKFEKTFVVDE